ncbi:Holliday junction DNA helicase subunit RuvA [Natronincola peptidivorans]|uniref:Holliday junction branch migration complex subunit RuvA n=1 Tax=Natronincola peptidivorans TaxID=426128 RepID=A0A1H9YXJ7_9FIRM|nr:Holliday junction branch migration protein RuvA [Natronincola peptidivorans]SES73892.1 Holliday junction DNA helicase subunit RuvA [Natronincola peptidivorans]
MFEYIKGKVSDVIIDKIIIEVGGIGYRIFSSINSAANIKQGDNVTVFTHFVLKEDEISLYGFITRKELDMFQKLISVSKVGPKVAISILSTYSPESLANNIMNNNIANISKAPGVGKKTAERIILELKDKVKHYGLELDYDSGLDYSSSNDEVVDALISLGYHRQEAERILSSIKDNNLTTEEMIKEALKLLMK